MESFTWSEAAEPELFIGMVKQHYHESSRTFGKFKSILRNAKNLDQNRLLSDIRSLFTNTPYLIHRFKRFLPNPNPTTPTESIPKPHSSSQKKSLRETLAFVNRVERAVDWDVFLKFVKAIMAYQKYNKASVRGVKKRKLVRLLEGHPALKAQLSAILREEEDNMHLVDLSFHRMLSARDAAEKLKLENQNLTGRMKEEIDVTDYFTQVDLVCIRDELEGCTVLADQRMSRIMAVEDSMKILDQLDYKIADVGSMLWTDKEMAQVRNDHQEEIEIPEWDWHSELSEDKYPDLPPIEFWKRPEEGKNGTSRRK